MEDFKAQAATTTWGVGRVQELVSKYGLETYLECTTMLLDYAEEVVRRAFQKMPDGDYTVIGYVDDDGNTDEPLKVQVNVHIRGDEMSVDFAGTSRQAKGNVNCPWACTQAGVFYTVIGIVDPYMVVNSGTFRPIKVESEEGLITRPLSPAGVTARTQTAGKILEAMLKAMSQIVPNRVVAGSHGRPVHVASSAPTRILGNLSATSKSRIVGREQDPIRTGQTGRISTWHVS